MNDRRGFFRQIGSLAVGAAGTTEIYKWHRHGVILPRRSDIVFNGEITGRIDEDFTCVESGGDIVVHYMGKGATYTILQFHRLLQEWADRPSNNPDDLIDISSRSPSERWSDEYICVFHKLDLSVIEHLYGGTLVEMPGEAYCRTWVNFSVFGHAPFLDNDDELVFVKHDRVVDRFLLRNNHNADPDNYIVLRRLIDYEPDKVIWVHCGENICVPVHKNGVVLSNRWNRLAVLRD